MATGRSNDLFHRRVNSAQKTRVQLRKQKCDIHKCEDIKWFCIDHKELACDSCLIQDHRKCDNLGNIAHFKGVKTSQELVSTKTSTESALEALKEFQSIQHETLQKLDTAELQCQLDLQDHRDKLVEGIDNLAKTDSAKIYSKFQGERAAIKQSIKTVDNQIITMDTIVKRLKESNGKNEPELFVYMKQGEKTEKESKQLLHTQQQSHKQILKYKFHSSIKKSLDDVNALGEFDEALSLKPTSLDPPSLKPVRLELRGEYTVETAGDTSKSTCSIVGSCLLPDASVMIVDWNNASLKQLDSSYKVIRSLEMDCTLSDVCYTNSNDEVAVTEVLKNTVHFVSVGTSLKKTRSFSVGNYNCWGIACSNGELFVCCGDLSGSKTQNVQVFSLAGKPLRTIQFHSTGQPLFSAVRGITISSCGNKLHVTDWDKGVITIDKSGNFQQQFQDENLEGADAICALDNGDLLVGDHNYDDCHNALHVSRDGWKLGEVLGEQYDYLSSLVFDPNSSRLIVTSSHCDTIKVYDVK